MPHSPGNTWMRYLLEQLTGHYTGAVYSDKDLKKVFPGEGIKDGSVVAVKLHHPDDIVRHSHQ